ncbi:hypothetical protein [Biostraticola tofi]
MGFETGQKIAVRTEPGQ